MLSCCAISTNKQYANILHLKQIKFNLVDRLNHRSLINNQASLVSALNGIKCEFRQAFKTFEHK
jgi:hypothetical protein